MITKIYNATKGYKRITSIVVVGVVAGLQYAKIIDDTIGKIIFSIAEAVGLYGIYDSVKNP